MRIEMGIEQKGKENLRDPSQGYMEGYWEVRSILHLSLCVCVCVCVYVCVCVCGRGGGSWRK